MQRQKGFTLIELIIVIIILGILAALAMPRLINFKSDARLAVVHSTVSTIESMNVMMYGKTTLLGVDTGTTKVDIDKLKDVDVTEGYLSATPENLINVLNLNATTEDKPDSLAGHEWLIQAITVDVGKPKEIQIRQITSPPDCSFIYTEATKETYPTYTKIPTLKDC